MPDGPRPPENQSSIPVSEQAVRNLLRHRVDASKKLLTPGSDHLDTALLEGEHEGKKDMANRLLTLTGQFPLVAQLDTNTDIQTFSLLPIHDLNFDQVRTLLREYEFLYMFDVVTHEGTPRISFLQKLMSKDEEIQERFTAGQASNKGECKVLQTFLRDLGYRTQLDQINIRSDSLYRRNPSQAKQNILEYLTRQKQQELQQKQNREAELDTQLDEVMTKLASGENITDAHITPKPTQRSITNMDEPELDRLLDIAIANLANGDNSTQEPAKPEKRYSSEAEIDRALDEAIAKL